MTEKMSKVSAEGLLKAGLGELGIEITTPQTEAFSLYLSEIKRWNRVYSLTALKTDEDIVIRHFIDSCLYLKFLPPGKLRIADVGSGAGLPGIPIKIIRPELNISLIEPSRKKATFLRHALRALGLEGMEVIEKPVEAAGTARTADFDVALTRALFTVKRFIAKASPIVKEGGLLLMSKGPKVVGELEGINVPYELKTAKLPMTDMTRYFVIIKPTASS